ncbi:MAG: TlpA family protein disulfide reductase [Methylococcaceae bacterium]|nr:TlpA family protein disulfide reductase [Methylococcaceae bacterium]
MTRRLVYGLLALAALGAGILTQRLFFVEAPPPLAEPMLVDLEGRSHALAEWRGKVVVLNFWATWCPPCREEMPAFVALQQELGYKGLQFVGVAIDDPGEVRSYLAKHPVNYPILVGDAGVPAWADSLGNQLSALPFSVVFDRDGRKVHAQTGLFRRAEVLDKVGPLMD